MEPNWHWRIMIVHPKKNCKGKGKAGLTNDDLDLEKEHELLMMGRINILKFLHNIFTLYIFLIATLAHP